MNEDRLLVNLHSLLIKDVFFFNIKTCLAEGQNNNLITQVRSEVFPETGNIVTKGR